jgi:hypothetical protein
MRRTRRERDLAMLQALLDDGRLDDHDMEAFASMKHRLEQAPNSSLSDAQRSWVKDKHTRFELDVEATNDVSSGLVKPAAHPMDFSAMGPKALAPPPRRRVNFD